MVYEVFEYVPGFINEIGVSILDTRDINEVEPEPEGENWVCKMKSRHFRTKEHEHRLKKRYVQGFPNVFLFGRSELISQKGAAEVLRQCFRQLSTGTESSSNNPCKAILVGHNAATNEKHLAQLGFDLSKEVVNVTDSEAMAMAVFRETCRSSLGSLSLRYGINAEYLHNAGNDA